MSYMRHVNFLQIIHVSDLNIKVPGYHIIGTISLGNIYILHNSKIGAVNG